MPRQRKLFASLLALTSVVALTACDPPITPGPGTARPGSINDMLTVDPSTLPPPPPPPITNTK